MGPKGDPDSMKAELERESFGPVAAKLRQLSEFLEHEHLTTAAQTFKGFAAELEAGVAPDRLRQIARELREALRAGPMSISDHPVTNPDGAVDAQATERFDALVGELRRFARQHGRKGGLLGLPWGRKR